MYVSVQECVDMLASVGMYYNSVYAYSVSRCYV